MDTPMIFGSTMSKSHATKGKFWQPKVLQIQERKAVKRLYNGWVDNVKKTSPLMTGEKKVMSDVEYKVFVHTISELLSAVDETFEAHKLTWKGCKGNARTRN